MIKLGNSYIDESKVCVVSDILTSDFTDLIWCYVNGAKVVDVQDNMSDFVKQWRKLVEKFSSI